MNLTRTNWPRGWLPSNDAVNGDPEGLLRADNLRFDKSGAVGLVDGLQALSASFSDYVSNLFSRIINNREYVWAAVGNPVTSVTRFFGPSLGLTSLVIADGGTPGSQASFGEAFGYTLVTAGAMRVKDPVAATVPFGPTGIIPLGMLTPNTPTVTINNQGVVTLPCPDFAFEGSGASPQITLDASTSEGQLCTSGNFLIDTYGIGGVPSNDPGLDLISFPFSVIDATVDNLTNIEIDFLLDGTPNDPATYENYFALKFSPTQINEQFPLGIKANSRLSFNRFNCARFGTDQTLDWNKIIGVRITVQAVTACTVQFGDIEFTGGAGSGLNGRYSYIQVDVRDDGHYLAMSPVSAPATDASGNTAFLLINGSVTIRPVIRDVHATEHRFYRKSETNVTGVNPVTGTPQQNSFLNQYYFVGKSNPGFTFHDTLSDIEVLQLNADGSLLPNLFLKTLNTNDSVNGLQDFIYGIEGLFNERMIYMGAGFVYLSDRLNPDAVDTRFTLKPSGDPGEKNLWIKKLTNNVLILATTKNLYELTGTLLEQPDGTIDARLVGIGEAYPPLSIDVCNYNGGLYYIAADGLRVTTGSNSINVSPQLRHLFQNVVVNTQSGVVARHGVPGVAIYSGLGGVDYSIATAHNNIYFILNCQDGTRRVIVYDTVNKVYGLRFTDPVKLFTTAAGELLAAFGSGAGNRIYIIDSTSGLGVDGVGIPFKLRTVFDANGQPRNRKDTFTLKIVFDSGNDPISVDIGKDGAGVTETDETVWTNLGHFTANGQSTIYIPLNNVSLGFRYAIQLSDVNGVKSFKLYEITIEYEPRPEQLDYLRILPTNMGTISRKRWTAFAFVIDTLGNNISFTPFLDNVAWSSSATFSTGTKLTYIFFFASEAIATDMGGILTGGGPGPGGVFEFYGIDLNECISEKLPPPVKYLVIPPDNYGDPNRKRHTSYKFQILTRGKNVQFTPQLDGVSYTPATFNTTFKQTVDYFFSQTASASRPGGTGTPGDVIGIDIGGILETLEDTPFEFYGNIRPQTLEILPDRLKYFRIPNSNLGIASRKRIRTLPLVIDTYGNDVNFTPVVDGVAGTPQVLNTDGKTTTYYYFNMDSFGTDYGGILSGGSTFEFYQLLRPEDVEVLPVPKLYDQLGPIRFDKIGKCFGFRLRIVATSTSLPWAIYDDFNLTGTSYGTALSSGSISTFANVDEIYEIPFPKNVNATVVRLVLGPTVLPFHRYDALLKVQTSGMESESRWIPIR